MDAKAVNEMQQCRMMLKNRGVIDGLRGRDWGTLDSLMGLMLGLRMLRIGLMIRWGAGEVGEVKLRVMKSEGFRVPRRCRCRSPMPEDHHSPDSPRIPLTFHSRDCSINLHLDAVAWRHHGADNSRWVNYCGLERPPAPPGSDPCSLCLKFREMVSWIDLFASEWYLRYSRVKRVFLLLQASFICEYVVSFCFLPQVVELY